MRYTNLGVFVVLVALAAFSVSACSIQAKPLSATSQLKLVTTQLPTATVGVEYTGEVSAEGGSEPYVYRIASGSIPLGVRFIGNGKFEGRPQSAGSWAMTIEVVDQNDNTALRSYLLRVE